MPANQRSIRLLDQFHNRLVDLAEQTGRLIVGSYGTIRPARDLDDQFNQFHALAVRIIGLGRQRASFLTAGFLRAYVRSESGKNFRPRDLVVESGKTRDGKSVSDLVVGARAKVFQALQMGRSVDEALAVGRFHLARMATTEVMDAANQEQTNQMANADPFFVGWRWKSFGTCPGCLGQDDGRLRSAGRPLNLHPNCRCTAEPVVRGSRDLVRRQTGVDRFNAADPKRQDMILGRPRAELIRRGAVGFDDLFTIERHERFHDSTVERPLKELLRLAGVDSLEDLS